MIELRHLVKRYPDGTTAVNDLSITAPTGKITTLVGPSGCGKTTTLRMINRLIDPTDGDILLNGKSQSQFDVIRMRRQIGYVIQSAGLFPHLTILKNICSLAYLEGVDKKRARTRALELLDLVGLDGSYGSRYPWQLSGGQRQRVGVARALMLDPPFLLMDEPFSAIDPIMRHQIQNEFLRIQESIAKTIVMVTHDVDEALRMGDFVVILKEGGILAQSGTPSDVLAHPADQFVRDFLGESRGYRSLGFHRLGATARLQPAPTVTLGTPVASLTSGTSYVVLDANMCPIGWYTRHPESAHEPVGAGNIDVAAPLSLAMATCRELLDAALAGPTQQAIVTSPDKGYLGVLAAAEILQNAQSPVGSTQ